MDPICNWWESREALERAKENVERYYSVVGILEKWNESLELFEHYVPRYFAGIRKVYKNSLKNKPRNQNNIKPKIPQYIKNEMMSNFTMEIEFYEFCKQRFNRQYLAVVGKLN